ncbi:MAG: iron ABC transporter permease [Treponemataceae bacterium]
MGSNKALRILLLLGLFVAVCGAALFLGRYPAPGFLPPFALRDDPIARAVVFGSRMPRILGAVLIGASLGGAGAAFQLVFANPLVEPGFLGVSQGAAFGAALSMILGAGLGPLTALSAFVFALIALLISSILARKFRYGGSVLRLVLAGISVSAVFSAGIAIIKYTADPLSQLPDITYWTLGGLSGLNWTSFRLLAPSVIVSLLLLLLLRRRIDLLSLDDEVARSLGARPEAERAFILASAALGVAASVAASGVVSWAGLVVPHVARAIVGADARASVPVSMILGALFLVVCDAAARTMFAGELPLGATVSALGAFVFVGFLASGRTRIIR